MIRINLLPVRQMKQKTRAIRHLVLSGAAIIAALVILLLGTGFLFAKVSGLEGDIKNLTARKKELQKTLDLIVELEKKKKLVEQQISIVHELQKKVTAYGAYFRRDCSCNTARTDVVVQFFSECQWVKGGRHGFGQSNNRDIS